MRRSPTNTVSSEERNARATIISEPVLPALRQRRSPEHAARIATKRRLFEFIQMLETRRAELGISRSAIARELGVTQPTISRLFSGHVQNIELRTMVRVAEVLDSDLELVIRPRTVVEIFGESELTERDAHLEDGEELMRKTSPAYDDFWRSRLEENDDIEGALRAVADGAGDQAIDVPGLTKKGKRPAGWGGSMCVWAMGLSGGRGAVHVQSLGRVLFSAGVLKKWPDKKFRISVKRTGNTLTIKGCGSSS